MRVSWRISLDGTGRSLGERAAYLLGLGFQGLLRWCCCLSCARLGCVTYHSSWIDRTALIKRLVFDQFSLSDLLHLLLRGYFFSQLFPFPLNLYCRSTFLCLVSLAALDFLFVKCSSLYLLSPTFSKKSDLAFPLTHSPSSKALKSYNSWTRPPETLPPYSCPRAWV